MGLTNQYNYFGGTKIYKRVAYKQTKTEAQRKAKLVREKGGLARIVKDVDGYTLWVRSSTRERRKGWN